MIDLVYSFGVFALMVGWVGWLASGRASKLVARLAKELYMGKELTYLFLLVTGFLVAIMWPGVPLVAALYGLVRIRVARDAR